jgi:hypothetical protein
MSATLANRFHETVDVSTITQLWGAITRGANQGPVGIPIATYDFQNFCSPLIGRLIAKLNTATGDPIGEALDPGFLADPDPQIRQPSAQFQTYPPALGPWGLRYVQFHDYAIDFDPQLPYANYHWELFHLLHSIAEVHHTNGRYDEELAFLRYILDTSCTDNVAVPAKYWKFLYFRQNPSGNAASVLATLADPNASPQAQQAIQNSYIAAMTTPFQPFAVGRARTISFAYYTVMKLLDCYLAKADSLLVEPMTIERVNEATQWVIKAANLLGPRPQQVPKIGTVAPKSYNDLGSKHNRDPLGDALVDLEAQFPFNLTTSSAQPSASAGPLLGLGRTLYFCIPEDQSLVGYWDVVDDRLHKIRNCENLAGQVQLMPLFDPPIDPGLLVAAAAAGLDIASAVAGLNQPVSVVRAPILIRKALDMANELRTLTSELQSAREKQDAAHIAQLRQTNDTSLQQLIIDTRRLQYQQALAAATAAQAEQQSAYEHYRYHMHLLGQTPVPLPQIDVNTTITAANFADAYQQLVTQFNTALSSPSTQQYSSLTLPQSAGASAQAGATNPGPLYLSSYENQELNILMPAAKSAKVSEANAQGAAAGFAMLPNLNANTEPMGCGITMTGVFGGETLANEARLSASGFEATAAQDEGDAASAAKTAGYQRRADEWISALNDDVLRLQGIGRQLLTLIIAQNAAAQELSNAQTQADDSQKVIDYMTLMFTREDLYAWMVGEILTHLKKYHQFVTDLARRAEATAKWELMRPEMNANTYIQPSYFTGAFDDLLAPNALIYDIQRLATDYDNYNLRELELTRSVSLRDLAPLSLLALKLTGTCTVSIPEWFFDRDCPGHYMRRLKSVAMSIPAMVNQDNPLHVTLMLQNSTLRLTPILKSGNYRRDLTTDDSRFRDYFGSADSVVTSSALGDTGLFETNLHDDRYLPFEGAGAISTWTISLPQIPGWDYTTMTDAKLVFRYTARDGGQDLSGPATKNVQDTLKQAMPPLLLSLRHDFPDEWWRFTSVGGTNPFTAALLIQHFPYLVSTVKAIGIDRVTVYSGDGGQLSSASIPLAANDLTDMAAKLKSQGSYALSLPQDQQGILNSAQTGDVYLMVDYHIATW